MITVKIYNKMEIEFFADSINEKQMFQSKYLSKMINFTGNNFGNINESIVTTYVQPDFICKSISYEAGQDVEIITFEQCDKLQTDAPVTNTTNS